MVLGRLPVGARCHAETQDLRPCNLPTFSNGAAGPAERTSFREPGENGAFQNHSRLRTPPLPLSHSHSPNHQHHAASINSLNRGNYTPRSNPSPAPTDSSAPPEGPASGQDCTQDNWLLNSNIPLETRNIAKQTFLETLQDNLIEMDILASARRDASYNDGHFLFKPGGTSPMYCTTSPGYPLTSSTVYSPPPRPLPRNTFSRPAFSLKKSYKHCNWKCAALSAILISVTLLFLLAYFIGESPLMLLHTGVSASTYTPPAPPLT
ncbi:Teneurin-4 [Dissostichus eleginoides]|nr:Teneurin-4 [Dissostichus eleginoides]